MSRRARLGLYAAGAVVLAVLLFAGLVWQVEGWTLDASAPNVERLE